jgi:hypothetical protein
MQCKCGGVVVEHNHEVKTLKAAVRWWERAIEKPKRITTPMLVEQHKCASCGRSFHRVHNL